MRKKKIPYIKIFAFGIAGYLFVMLCVTAVSVAIIYSKHQNLVSIAQNDWNYYAENKTFNPRAEQNKVNNFVYSPDGSREAFLSGSGAEARFDFDGYARKLSSHISGSRPAYRLVFSMDLPYHIAVAVAVPMENGGVFLFLKELPDAYRVLVFQCFALTVLFVLCILYLLLALHRNQRLERMQREYVDNVSHELKSPIAAVKALAEPIYEGMVRDEDVLRKYSGIILHEVSNLEKMVSDMLELSRLQNRRQNEEKECMAAEIVFGDVVEKYASLCDDFGLSFSVSPTLKECPALRTNRALASRLLDILLDNAVKFTETNGVIQVRLTKQLRHVKVMVCNDGPQIAPNEQKRVFERFFQGTHDKRGSGLGLAIAKEISEHLQIGLRLEHSILGDTAFSFTVETP